MKWWEKLKQLLGGDLLGNSTIYKKSSGLPDQTDNNGKFLTTDGTTASWAALAGGGDMAAATYDPAGKSEQVLTVGDILDEDNMATDSATKVPSQQSVKAYVDAVPQLSDGDKGDITVSASGATWTIDNDVVTYAKMQNVSATDKLLGRSTAGAGDVEEITCTSAGRALLDDANAAAQRTTLELGTIATQAANNVSITGGSVTGITDLAVADGGTGASTAAAAAHNLIDGISLTAATVAAADKLLLQDADGSDVLKTATATSVAALATPEGTAVKSTGEAGGTKFLREDGDGTCSWQTPSYPTRDSLGLDTDDTVTFANLSGTNTGDQTLPTRDSLGVDTDDSPQFAGINLGHASDTTFARVSAGVASIEGNNIITANITASETVQGVVELATTAETTTGTDTARAVTPAGVKAVGDTKLALAGGTMTGNIVLDENASVDLDPALSADGKYTGICITGTAGATLAFGDLVYLAAADSRWELADASAAGTAGTVLLGICVLAAASDGSATKILLQGNVRADTAFPTLTIGGAVYAGETAGDVVTTAPTTADAVVRVLGFGLTADSMVFMPSASHSTVTG